jgi:hypothetical protein
MCFESQRKAGAAYPAYIGFSAHLMTKRDNEKDSERPHYYSQFWLDVAAGRRIIGTPKPNEEDEQTEAELLEPVSHLAGGYVSSTQQSNTASHAATNGRTEGVVSPEVESEIEASSDEEYIEPEEDLDLTFADMEATDNQDLPVEDTDIPDMDLSTIDEEEEYLDEEEQNEFEDIEDIEEEDDEVSWGRGRKKPKPSRQVKPSSKKPTKRDSRRGGY